jgi:hypothetical protein
VKCADVLVNRVVGSVVVQFEASLPCWICDDGLVARSNKISMAPIAGRKTDHWHLTIALVKRQPLGTRILLSPGDQFTTQRKCTHTTKGQARKLQSGLSVSA